MRNKEKGKSDINKGENEKYRKKKIRNKEKKKIIKKKWNEK